MICKELTMYPTSMLDGNMCQYRTLRMLETGLIDHWKEMYSSKPVQCMVDPSSRQAKLTDVRNPALVNLHGLIPAFIFLLFGFILASMALLTEWIAKLQLWKCIPPFRSLSQIIEV